MVSPSNQSCLSTTVRLLHVQAIISKVRARSKGMQLCSMAIDLANHLFEAAIKTQLGRVIGGVKDKLPCILRVIHWPMILSWMQMPIWWTIHQLSLTQPTVLTVAVSMSPQSTISCQRWGTSLVRSDKIWTNPRWRAHVPPASTPPSTKAWSRTRITAEEWLIIFKFQFINKN